MKQEKLEAYLGRSLSATETTNIKTYLNIAREQLDSILCYFGGDEDTREYDPRIGYRSLFTEPFTEVREVTVDGEASTAYTVKQWNSRRGDWFNVIEFDDPMEDKDITVNAEWGFGNCMPTDLEFLLAQLFNFVANGSKVDGRVQSKRLDRSFSVTYRDKTGFQQLLDDHAATILKYSLCNVGEIRHGDTYGRIRSVWY